jgi:hypothetical protein
VKAVLYDGAECADRVTSAVARAAYEELADIGVRARRLCLREMQIGWCRGCLGCWVQSPGLCVRDDDAHTVMAAYVKCDVAVFVTRVTFGGYSAQAKRAVDCLLGLLSVTMRRYGMQVRHAPRYVRMPRLLVVGVAPVDKEEMELFRAMVAAQARSLHAPRARALAVHAPADLEGRLPRALSDLGVAA